MIIYEVNLHVEVAITEEYASWLELHIEEMMQFEGFERAIWYEVEGEPNGYRHWTVQYHLEDRKALQAYLEGPAQRMRQEGLEDFEGRFSADRRVLAMVQAFTWRL